MNGHGYAATQILQPDSYSVSWRQLDYPNRHDTQEDRGSLPKGERSVDAQGAEARLHGRFMKIDRFPSNYSNYT